MVRAGRTTPCAPPGFSASMDAGVLFFGRRVCYTGLKVHKRELNGRETERQPIPAEKGLLPHVSLLVVVLLIVVFAAAAVILYR